jgi:hypothetical protein
MDVEEALKRYLEKEASAAGMPPELTSSVYRKARLRRVLSASVLSAALVAASIGGLVAVRALLPISTEPPVDREPSATTDLKMQIAQARARVEVLRKELIETEALRAALKAQLDELGALLEEANGEQKRRLERRVVAVRQRVAETGAVFASLRRELDAAEAHLAGLLEPADCADSLRGYRPNVPEQASPGAEVTVSGPIPVLNEQGEQVGSISDRLQVWWNLDPEKWETALPGQTPAPYAPGSPPKLLAELAVAGRCAYSVNVTLPQAPPGTYTIIVVDIVDDPENQSSVIFPPATVTLT